MLHLKEAELFALCSLLFARCSLLFIRCSLLFGCCLLLFARCSLLFAHCSLLFARFSLLFARCSLFFRPNYCEIKLLSTAKKWFDNNETPPQIFSLQITEILVSTCKIICKVDLKSQILPELASL